MSQLTCENSELKRTIDGLTRENISLSERLREREKHEGEYLLKIDELKKQVDESKWEKESKETDVKGIQRKLDEANKDCVGLRAEIGRTHLESRDLKIQLDKKINLLCAKEKELREANDNHKEEIDRYRKITEPTRFSSSLERDSVISHSQLPQYAYYHSVNPRCMPPVMPASTAPMPVTTAPIPMYQYHCPPAKYANMQPPPMHASKSEILNCKFKLFIFSSKIQGKVSTPSPQISRVPAEA